MQAGDILIVLARDLPEARLAQKQADEALEAAPGADGRGGRVDLVRQELERLEKLKGSSAFPKAVYEDKRQELVRRRSRVREAAAARDRARVQREMAEIELAPHHRPRPLRRGGDRAPGPLPEATSRPETRSATLVDDQRLEVEADVPADRLGGLVPGHEGDP